MSSGMSCEQLTDVIKKSVVGSKSSGHHCCAIGCSHTTRVAVCFSFPKEKPWRDKMSIKLAADWILDIPTSFSFTHPQELVCHTYHYTNNILTKT